jgi:hypothetical protein
MINLEEHKRQLDEILRNIPLSENDLNDLKVDCETKIDQIKSDLIQIDKRFNTRLKENRFCEYNGKEERLLGEILYNNFLTECSKGNHFCIYSKMVIRVSCICRSSKHSEFFVAVMTSFHKRESGTRVVVMCYCYLDRYLYF